MSDVKRIALWGAGGFGRYVFSQLSCNNSVEIIYIIDRNGDEIENRDYFFPVQIIKPTEIDSLEKFDFLLISIINGIDVYTDGKDIIQNYSHHVGIIKDELFYQKRVLENDLERSKWIYWINDVNKPIIKQIETNIIDICNLNCKGCSHFSQLYNINDTVPFETFAKDLKQISNKSYVIRLNLLGGEVLLKSDLCKYLEYSRRLLPYSDIYIITNGMLMLSINSDIFDCINRNNIIVDITKYPPTAKIEDRITRLLKEKKVNFHFRAYVKEFGKNIDLEGKANILKSVKECREHECHFFRYGKLYKCPFEALSNRFFEHYNLGISLDGGKDIYDEELNWNEYIDILENKPVDACKYCGKEERYPWEIAVNPEKDDWTINNYD